jgi:hypothetical protein
MKKLLLLVFVSSLFTINAQSYKYDFKSKVDIEAAIQTTNLNDIYNQVGVHRLGYGYYVGTVIGKKGGNISVLSSNLGSELSKQGTTTDIISNSEFQFRQNGQNYILAKTVFLHKHGSSWYPILSRREAIEVVSEMKKLLELELMTQEEYDEEFKKIRKVLSII